MWTQSLKSSLFSVLFAVCSVFGIGLLITNGESFATSWTSQNVRSLFSHSSGSISFSTLGFTGDDFFIPEYVSVHIESSGNTTSGGLSNNFRFPSSYPYIYLYGPTYYNVSTYDNITFSSCSSSVRSDITASSLFSYSFADDMFNSITTVVFTFSDECLGSSSGITPSGSLSITENGTYDVTNYAEAVVDVPTSSGGSGDYSDDIAEVKKAIILIPATLLLIYFFYCIYRIIIGNLRS